ncbi:oligomeric complex COG6 [Trametes punicea]|nr:oligomeric complex COG6 [Trametes punicea]
MSSAVSASASSSHPQGSSPSHSTQPQAQNPISLRLYKILSANFDDDATREALDTLAALYAPPSLAPSAKGKDVEHDADADADADADDEREEEVSGSRPTGVVVPAGLEEGVAGDIAARARKNLRRDVESRLAESSKQFLKAFGGVDKHLDTLQEHIGLMRVRCDEAQTQLRETNAACKSLLDRAGSLREERQGVAVRQSIISAFLSRFTLSPSEKDAISSWDVPIGPTFFAAMDKAARIQADCRVLLTASLTLPTPSATEGEGDGEDGEDRATKAGRDILAATASQLEQAYDKIFRWCSFEFRQMGKDASLDVSPTMREAVKRLRERPELLMEALTYLSQTRQATLLSSFMDALTRGGPGGLPRPIELHAHDPLRYVGDMLAWVHQAIAAEHEFLESLFGARDARRMVGAARSFGGSAEEGWIAELMDGAVRGLCGPLRVRVQQTVRSQESSITSYKIANLLQFYAVTMQRTVGREALLSKTLEELTELAYSVFYGAIEAQGRSLLHVTLDLDDTGVSPPLAIVDHAQVLREMMAVYESSLLGDEQEEELQAGFRDILDKMVDPALEMTLTQAEEKKRQRPGWDKAVFVLNTLAYVQGVLEPFAFTTEKRGVVQGLVDAKVLQLIEEHYQDLLRDAGLAEVAAACETRSEQGPLSHVPAAEPASLQRALGRFSEWLSGAEVVQSRRLGRLAVQSVAGRVQQAALERVAATYERICEEVRRPENKYEAGATLLGSERPFGQVRLLWQIFGLEGRGEGEGEGEAGSRGLGGTEG